MGKDDGAYQVGTRYELCEVLYEYDAKWMNYPLRVGIKVKLNLYSDKKFLTENRVWKAM